MVRWIGASRPVISALLVASGHSVCKFKTRQQQMNIELLCSLMKIFIQVKLLSSLTSCTHNTPKESRLRPDIYSPAKKPLFGKPHEQSSYSVCSTAVCALDADRQLYFARFCLGRMFVYSLDGDASFCHESEALTEVSGSGK